MSKRKVSRELMYIFNALTFKERNKEHRERKTGKNMKQKIYEVFTFY